MRVARGDLELDERAGCFTRRLPNVQILHATLDLQTEVGCAGLISAEAEFESVLETIQAEMMGALRIGQIKEGTLAPL
jgi:hypothetical protein